MTDSRLVLTLDASTPQCTLALGRLHLGQDPGSGARGDRAHEYIAGEEVTAVGRAASSALCVRLSAMLTGAGFQPSDLDVLACGTGPGMFTGVRVAIATVKGIAVGLGIPAIGVSTLAAVAATPLEGSAPPSRLALLDARRSEVYAGLYRVDATGVFALQADVCGPLESVLETLEGPVAAVGPGVEPYAELLRAHPAVVRVEGRPGPEGPGLWHATACRWPARSDGAALAAAYLRKSYAELGINQAKRPFVPSPFVEDPR